MRAGPGCGLDESLSSGQSATHHRKHLEYGLRIVTHRELATTPEISCATNRRSADVKYRTSSLIDGKEGKRRLALHDRSRPVDRSDDLVASRTQQGDLGSSNSAGAPGRASAGARHGARSAGGCRRQFEIYVSVPGHQTRGRWRGGLGSAGCGHGRVSPPTGRCRPRPHCRGRISLRLPGPRRAKPVGDWRRRLHGCTTVLLPRPPTR